MRKSRFTNTLHQLDSFGGRHCKSASRAWPANSPNSILVK